MISNPAYDLAHNGNVEGIRDWLNQNPEAMNSFIDEGFTLLHIACAFGHEALVSFLLNRGALVNIDADNKSRATPLHLAVAFRDEEVADAITRLLIRNGAELNAMQADGQTPLHHAIARRSLKLVNTLIGEGADPFLKDKQGRASADLAKDLEGEGSEGVMRAALKKAFSLPLEVRE